MQPSMGGSPTAARFDLSGLYLAVGGTEARVVGVKQEWAQLANLSAAIGNKVRTRHHCCTTLGWLDMSQCLADLQVGRFSC